MYHGRHRQRICISGICNVFQPWGCNHNSSAGTSWAGEPTLTPSGNTQTVPLHPQLISNHNQILPPRESSVVVRDGILYTFICPVTWIWIQFWNHSGILCMLWLKIFNLTVGFFVRNNNFTWSKSYFLREEPKQNSEAHFPSFHESCTYFNYHFLRKSVSL